MAQPVSATPEAQTSSHFLPAGFARVNAGLLMVFCDGFNSILIFTKT
jgi:hypothetical protein